MANIPFPTVPYPSMEPPAHREKKMKVLALGMSRTGTMSLYVALKKLGYNCYHMAECSLDQRNRPLGLWTKAINAKFNGDGPSFRAQTLTKCFGATIQAVTDIPCILFAEELMDAYPDAQIVLTTRPVDSWLSSMQRTFYAILSWKRWALLEFIDRVPTHLIPGSLYSQSVPKHFKVFRLPTGFEAHYDQVHAAARARERKVLEFKVQDGWDPLCQFLGKETSDEPFPHVNEGDFIARFRVIIIWVRVVGLAKMGLVWASPVVAVGAAWWYFG
ncbi:NAD dependent epimerase/dehydratase [Aspergillus arachidicola]|uniref:NAD dependent epimerase/dehydratase n=1 Tax=Aspergillus arachidicola TaxID=656916 RepID=A0A2G7GDD8_9EURO|nr:NAD dependent epimerase/dehydratase [Aspergillus arachidicola]